MKGIKVCGSSFFANIAKFKFREIYTFSIFVNLSDREISSNKVQTERWHLKINFI